LASRSLSHLIVCAGLIAGLTSLASSATAADATPDTDRRETARTLFNEGLEYADAGRWQEAALRFRRAYEVKSTAEIGYNLAQAYIHLGYLASGVELLRRAGDDPDAAAAVREAARARLRQVAPRLGGLTVQVPRQPGTYAYLDGRTLESHQVGVNLPVDPGPHLVQARFPDGADLSRRVTLAEGEETTVTLAPPNFQAAAPKSTPSVGLLRRGWFWVAVAGVAAGTAVAFSIPHTRGNDVSGNVGTWHVDR
jgi:hypothetical protein